MSDFVLKNRYDDHPILIMIDWVVGGKRWRATFNLITFEGDMF